MQQVTIHQAKTQLSKLIQAALAGEEVIIAKGQQPLVRLQVLAEAQPRRQLNSAADLIVAMDDEDFNAPLDDFHDYQ